MSTNRPIQTQAGPRSGFSLLELIVVMTILGMISMAVMPVFRGTLNDVEEEHSVRDLLATMEYAQSRAITEAIEYRLYIDPGKDTYWLGRFGGVVKGKKTFAMVRDQYGITHTISRQLDLLKPRNMGRDRGSDSYYMTFYPSGASDVVTIELAVEGERNRLKKWRISTKGSLAQFDVKEPTP